MTNWSKNKEELKLQVSQAYKNLGFTFPRTEKELKEYELVFKDYPYSLSEKTIDIDSIINNDNLINTNTVILKLEQLSKDKYGKGWQSKLSIDVDIQQASLSKMFNYKKIPTLKTIVKIADSLGYELDYKKKKGV